MIEKIGIYTGIRAVNDLGLTVPGVGIKEALKKATEGSIFDPAFGGCQRVHAITLSTGEELRDVYIHTWQRWPGWLIIGQIYVFRDTETNRAVVKLGRRFLNAAHVVSIDAPGFNGADQRFNHLDLWNAFNPEIVAK